MKARDIFACGAMIAIVGLMYGCPAPEADTDVKAVTGATGQGPAASPLMAQVRDAELRLAKGRRIDVNREYAEAAKAAPKDAVKAFLDNWTKPSREEAEAWFREIAGDLTVPAAQAPYNLALGTIYYEWKVNDRAIQMLQKVLAAEPGNSLALYYKGLYHIRRDEADDAIQTLQKAIETEPNFALAHIAIGRAYQKKKDIDKAIAAFEESVKQDPRIFEAHYTLGQLYGEKGKGEQAIAELVKAAELNPDNLDVQVNLAKTFEKTGKLDEAIAAYERASKIKPMEAELYVAQAKLHQKKKDKAKEYEAWDKTVKYDPRNIDAQLALSWLSLERGELDKAEKGFQEAARKRTDDHMIFVGLARIAVKREDYRKAMEHYRRALRIESASKEAKEELADLRKKFEITSEPYTAPSLEKVFAAFQSRILKAYKVLLRTYPKIKGKVTIQVGIDNEGTVTDVGFEENTVNHPALEACIYGNALMAKFPAGKKGKVNYTMNFDPALAK